MLILGSLPGRASLKAQQYYAQPRNAFWWIMGALCAAQPEFEYGARLAVLKRSGVALWDVLQEAVRPGSLDSDIIAASQRINDIAGLIEKNPSIELIAFNGKKAAEIFHRRIESALPPNKLRLATLPSTSPAHASLKREEKLLLWRQVVAPHLRAD